MTAIRHLVLLFGEILIDRFPDQEVLGGAPFNVAMHLCAFGCMPVLVSRIGQDNAGSRLLQALENLGLAIHGVQLDSTHSTGMVEVHFAADGHRFDILPDRAYDHIHPRLSRMTALGSKPRTGLFWEPWPSEPTHRALRHMFVCAVWGSNVSFDVNLRDPWVSAERLRWSLQHADIVKANDTELERIVELIDLEGTSPEEQAKALVQRYQLDGLLITRGEAGSWWIDNFGEQTVMATDPVAGIRDTVGAGDAFSAIFMLGLLHNWTIPITLRRARTFSGAICQIRGAVPEHDDFYRPFLEEWFERR